MFNLLLFFFFFFSSRRRHTRWNCDWSSDVCSSDLHKSGLSAWADGGCNPGECKPGCSPPTIAFVDPITFPPLLPERNPAVDPAFTFSPPNAVPNRATNPATGIPFEGRTQVHQFRDRFPPQQFFATRMRPNFNATFSDDPRNLARIGKNLIWGFNRGGAEASDVAVSPGPLIAPRYGRPLVIRRFNDFDTGDETTGFRLPSFFPYPAFDLPLVLTDKLFTPDGELCFDTFGLDGLVGDKFLVNGKIQPFMEVKRRRYRFRVLDGGPSRFYELFLTNPDNLNQKIPLTAITTTDGNLLDDPIRVQSVRLAVAERADIIIDFDEIFRATGARTIRLENRLEQVNGRAPTDKILPAGDGDFLMEFRIAGNTPAPDASLSPAQMIANARAAGKECTFAPICTPPRPTDNAAAKEDRIRVTRTFRFERRNGQWAINQQFADCTRFRFTIERNTAERWIIQNNSGGWQHPIHIHLEEFQMVRRNNKLIRRGDIEFGRKDVARLGFNEEIELLFRFRDFRGGWPMHCHNTIHEDHAMLLLFQVADEGDKNRTP